MEGKNLRDKIFSERTGIILAISGFAFIVLSIIAFICFRSWSFSTTMDEAKVGQFGDLIGGIVGSVFSLASVILFYVALNEQRKDIGINQKALNLQIDALNQQVEEFKAQKEELEETRRVYVEQTNLIREQTESQKQQVKEFKFQSTIYNLQQFDSSFYSILNVLIHQKQLINKDEPESNFFKNLYFQICNVDIKNKKLIESLACVTNKYLEVYNSYESPLLLYCKTIYRIIKVIDDSNIEEIEKNKYSKILFSQLSSYELILLHYNYSTHFGTKIKPLLIKYNFFNYVPTSERIECSQNCLLIKNYKYKAGLTNFIKSISELVVTNYTKANDIENNDDINLSEEKLFLDYNSTISLTIDNKLELSIAFEKSVWDSKLLEYENEIQLYFNVILTNTFYSSKYKPIEKKFIEEEVLTSDSFHKLIFKINDIKNI